VHKNRSRHALHLLAFADKEVVGLASRTRPGGWRRISDDSMSYAPEYAAKASAADVNEIIEVARQSGLKWLEAELFDKQQGIKMFGCWFSHVLTCRLCERHAIETHDYS